MPSRTQSIAAVYRAWNTSTGQPVTGDAANHAIKWARCSAGATTTATATNTPTEIGNGDYQVLLSMAEATVDSGVVSGGSSTANVVLIGVPYTFEQLPAASPAASGGLLTFGTSAGQINPMARAR